MAVRTAKCPECGTVVQSSWKFCPGCSASVAKAFETTVGEQVSAEGGKHRINWIVVLSIAGVFILASLGYIAWVANAPERFAREQQAQSEKDRAELVKKIIGVFGNQAAFDQFLELEAEKKLVVAQLSRWSVDGQYYHIVGIVANDSSRQVVYWQVDFEVLNENGNVLNSGLRNSVTPIPPGGKERWEAFLPGVDPTAARVTHRISQVRFDD